MKILFVSSEIFPFAKSGGLADVAASLPKALNSYSNITSIMPLYGSIDLEKHNINNTGINYSFWVDGKVYYFEVFQSGNTVFLKDNAHFFDRDEMYGDYDDNDLRFGIFCYAVIEYIKAIDGYFDILHINDWQSSLIALLAREHYKLDSKIVFTIHNLAYQGIFSKESIKRLGLRWNYFNVSKLEYHDRINLLKSAIVYSDIVTTVSPTYAKEIQSVEFGCNLENLMQDNDYKLKGILNGIDYDEFNPSIDKYIPINFDSNSLEHKKEIKSQLLKELNLYDAQKPLFIFIGRFTAQKGIDQILDTISELAQMPINIVILGFGEEHYNYLLGSISDAYENVAITIGYNEALARKLYASANFLYMPSQYEPCGLNQMIAMKYGTIPIVRDVGGLKDSVSDFENCVEGKGIGITFEHGDRDSLIYATKRAIWLYLDKNQFDEVVNFDMNIDFSWDAKSKEYVELYKKLIDGWLPKSHIKEFEIPFSYNINTLKTIAVNPDTLYTYWEITDELLSDNLKLLAFADGELAEEVDLYDRLGNYYFYNSFDFKKVQTKIGFYDENGTFTTILSSNIFIAPNAKVIHSNNIIWRNITTQKLSSKQFMMLDKTFYETYDSLSSSSLQKRKRLQELGAIITNQSSLQVAKKESKND